MRDKLNSNPLAQLAVVGCLLLAVGVFVMSSMGGGGEEEGETTTTSSSATLTTPEGSASVTATVTTPVEGAEAAPTSVPPLPPEAASAAPKLPRSVTSAFADNRTVVLLFVHDGGIDDQAVKATVAGLHSLPDVTPFVVPADRIARYAAIAQGVAVDRVPALVVLRPKRLNHGIPVASVHYGFQSPESVTQAVIDAGYKGRTLDYHP
ncbi:MAG TPA: hypothetical protein VN758_12520 [Solirubrobacterales bacterium]|nr:hypothetical protein [Solirubrobacterales bacterium]